LEQARMQHMSTGYDSGDKTPLRAIAYVTMQELATRIAHRNTGKASRADGDILADNLMQRISADENLHMVFYRNLGRAALDIAPNKMMRAITDEVIGFQMPGASIPNFARDAVVIAKAGIYDLEQHVEKVVQPTLEYWEIETREDLTDDGARARDELYATMDFLRTRVERIRQRNEERRQREEASS
jgi:acyl-[acyl-carrier-protein] desaturase